MEVKDRRILVMGGAGLVGMAVCRELLKRHPAAVIVGSIDEASAREAVLQLQREFPTSTATLIPIWGNLFVRHELKDLPPRQLAESPFHRDILFHDLYAEMSGENKSTILHQNALYRLIRTEQPHAIVDCINTATVFAYQRPFEKAKEIKGLIESDPTEQLNAVVEDFLTKSAIPQLVRHIQILLEACRADPETDFEGVKVYLKVGTSGTGGMGLNIPFTHGEERPSRDLLSKAAVAGAHTMLLFLMGRTPGAPIIKEVKPTAAIAWKRIAHDTVLRRGQPIPLYDCLPDAAYPINEALLPNGNFGQAVGQTLQATFIDTGENGLFSANEFKVISSLGLMQLVTPEEIARTVVSEILGGTTGNDVIAGLDATVMGSTYRAGSLRHIAVERLNHLQNSHGREVAAFEMLGPPRLSKLLYEAEILTQTLKSTVAIVEATPRALSDSAYEYVKSNAALRQAAISVGIPILTPDGNCLLRGPEIKTKSAEEGWIDLRPSHMAQWQNWIRRMLEEAELAGINEGWSTGSGVDRHFNSIGSWALPACLDVGEMVAWIFRTHDEGERIKG